MTTIPEAQRVQSQLSKRFRKFAGFRGIGITWDTTGNAHILVNVDAQQLEQFRNSVPSVFEGVKIEFRAVSNLRAF